MSAETSKEQWKQSKDLLLKRRDFYSLKLEKALEDRAQKLASMLKTTKLKEGEDPYSWPVMYSWNRSVKQWENCLEEVEMDLKCANELIKEAE